MVAFTHIVESVLDEVRSGAIALGEPLIELLLACGDHIGKLVDAVDAGQPALDAQMELAGVELAARLNQYLNGVDGDALAVTPSSSSRGAVVTQTLADGEKIARWHISLRFGESVLRNGMDPLSFIRYLSTLGTIERIVTIPDALPALRALDPESCYLGFEIAFMSDADQATIESVFEFVIDDCAVRVLPAHDDIANYAELIAQLPEDSARLGEQASEATATRERDSSISTTATPSPARTTQASETKHRQNKDAKGHETQSVRVDADKLDRLIDLVGELITAAAGANLIARRSRDAALQEANATLVNLVESVRDSALQLRMVKIGATFGRFRRVVHDVARELGKDIELRTSGEDTELDKTVVEKIGDPLMHLVRNAMDHGIDAPDVRLARGKPAQGTVALNAYHDSGSIVIEVGDDGGGLDRERILAKAVERGLVEPGKSLSDAEIYGLIFEPGFSTAEQITNLSGRGVGMDVVKRNNGFEVSVGKSVFVVPLDVVDECVKFSAEADHDYTDLRGEVLPFSRLRELFEVPGEPSARQNIVVVKHAGQKFGLVVDALMGEAQTVIKPLSRIFAQVKGISGSSILGSGEVALILDVPALLQQIQTSANASANFAANPAVTTDVR